MGSKIAAYLPFMIALNIAAYEFYNETDKYFSQLIPLFAIADCPTSNSMEQ